MTVNEIQKKIDIKNEQIAKREQLKEKHIKTGDRSDYFYESHIRNHENKLKELNGQLERLQKQLDKQSNIENAERIPAIEKLLDQWEYAYRNYIGEMCKEYAEMQAREKIIFDNFKANHPKFSYNTERKNESESYAEYLEFRSYQKEISNFRAKNREVMMDEYDLNKLILNEKKNKRFALIIKVTDVVGKIQYASGLHFGYDSGINGVVVGDKCSARVQTIYAGGYNIQCLHFRVLVKPVK